MPIDQNAVKWDSAPDPFESALASEGVSGKLASVARSIYQQESGSGSNTKTSNAGAVGGMQIIPSTFSSVADKDWSITDPVQNARAGIRYLKQLDKQSGGDPALTAAGYYGGPGGMEKARKGVAVSDPRNPNAPNTIQYGQQVAARANSDGPVVRGLNAVAGAMLPSAQAEALPSAKIDPASVQWDEPAPKAAATKVGPSADYIAGKDKPGWQQGLASVINGPLMGFGDELLGGAGAVIDKIKNPNSDLGANYTANRDTVRGMQDAQRKENPWTTGITQAMASAPMLVLNPLGKLVGLGATAAKASAVSGAGTNAMRAVGSGAGYGAVQGVGDSRADNAGGVLADGAKGAALGGALGGAGSVVSSVVGAGARNVGQRFSEKQATKAADQKLAEAFARDARGEVFTSGQANPVTQAASRFGKLGGEATMADAGGKNTSQLLDTLATLPGRTKEAAGQVLRQRTATVGPRMRAAADEALGTGGQRLPATIDDLIAQRTADAAPLYERVRKLSVEPSPELTSVLSIADKIGAMKEARKSATASGATFTYDMKPPVISGVTNAPVMKGVSMGDMDHVKRGLDQMIGAETNAITGKLTPIGAKYQSLKVRLINELDNVTTDPHTGESVYKQARTAFEGPSKLIDAANAGKRAIGQDEAGILGSMKNMGPDELQSFRIGAFEGLRGKLGTQGGQTNIMNMWKEPATQEKLKAVFGNERAYREFAASVAKEASLKRLQSVGAGSQTAARMAGMGDLDASALREASTAAAAAKSGNLLAAAAAAKGMWNRVALPETVRNEMGGSLLLKGGAGQRKLSELTGLIQQINDKNATVSQGIGVAGSQIGSRIAPPMRIPPAQPAEASTGVQSSFAGAPGYINVQAPPSAFQPPATPATPEDVLTPDVQPEVGELGAAAKPAEEDANPVISSSMRPDGTLAISGDPQALHATLIAAGIPARSIVRNAAGVMVGRSQASRVQEVIARMGQPGPEDVATGAAPVEVAAENQPLPATPAGQADFSQAAPLVAGADAALPDATAPDQTQLDLTASAPAGVPDVPALEPEPNQAIAQAGYAPQAINSGVEDVAAAAPEPIDIAAHAAATSPHNDRPEPTLAQQKAGNYALGHDRIAGMDVSIENPQGSTRRGVDPDGKPWETQMQHHYGYFKRTTANDGDKLDVFIKPGTPRDFAGPVFVIDQTDPSTGKLDEHKVVMGAASEDEAKAIYRSNYADDWQGMGPITRLPLPAFRAWAASGDKRHALGDLQAQRSEGPAVQVGAAGQAMDATMAPQIGTAERIQRLHDAGEKEVAGILQRNHDREQTLGAVQTELAGMRETAPDLPHHQNNHFQAAYQQQRTAGAKPAEAAARAGILAAVQETAPGAGMPEKAVAALQARLDKMPVDDAPGFVQRFTQALIAKGVMPAFQGADQIEQMLVRARDGSMNAMADAVYRGDAAPSA